MVNHFAAEDERKKLMKVFEELDEDKNGFLDKEEIIAGYKKFNMLEYDRNEVNEIISRIDRNNNAAVDYSEFVIAAINKKKLLAKKNLEATFKMIDKDKSKYITADELKEFFMGSSDDKEWDD
mmetsp:Transcript_27355/g.24126  ORF Transcript_27355/g.24126 Transcript_27355/m.24126 type:complete len:123 (-) Transcript_27355:110-478(-)